MRRLQAPDKHGLWFYSQRHRAPCTQTNRQVGFEPVEKVPTRDGKNEVRTGGKKGISVLSRSLPGITSSNSALSPSAKVQDKNRRRGLGQ